MRPEQTLLLHSYLSSSTVGHCLHVKFVFSYVLSYFGSQPPYTIHELYMINVLSITAFHQVFSLLLSRLCSLFHTQKGWYAQDVHQSWATLGYCAPSYEARC
jgi:hypothetical protein